MNKIVIGNLKMNLQSIEERERYLKEFSKELIGKKFQNTEIVLCLPFVHLEGFKKWKNKKVIRGALNVFWEDKGSFTGEISPLMLKNFGCQYVVVGHSERRKYAREEDSDVNLKIIAALRNGIKPILCVGENAGQKARGLNIILEQLKNCLSEVSGGKIENIIICYEPVWAISSNNPDHLPTTNEIMSAGLIIKKFLVGKYGVKISEKVKIIYGGSVSVATVKQACVESGMDGALIGRESLTPREFLKIGEIINQ
ncbi:MAG TPA: triose-phosphate isomerase [Candidatus Moranbacteria bacterium]|nr:triose-phosphate isomerase [Candidatus Moranbacteria bacterium]HAT74619.1 triose-phosphate isomerase [Candidatus Moranbacteria bacterium]